MFTPNETTERFDRNIFREDGMNQTVALAFKPDTPMLFYYKSDTIVGYLSGKHTVKVHNKFAKNGYLPVSVEHNHTEYCGWVAEINLKQ